MQKKSLKAAIREKQYRRLTLGLGVLIGIAVIVGPAGAFFSVSYLIEERAENLISKNVIVAGKNYRGVAKGDFERDIEERVRDFSGRVIELRYDGATIGVVPAQIGAEFAVDEARAEALTYAQEKTVGKGEIGEAFLNVLQPREFELGFKYDEAALAEIVGDISRSYFGNYAKARAAEMVPVGGGLEIEPGVKGQTFALAAVEMAMRERLAQLSDEPIDLRVVNEEPEVNPRDAVFAKLAADKIAAEALKLKYEGQTWGISSEQIAEMIVFKTAEGAAVGGDESEGAASEGSAGESATDEIEETGGAAAEEGGETTTEERADTILSQPEVLITREDMVEAGLIDLDELATFELLFRGKTEAEREDLFEGQFEFLADERERGEDFVIGLDAEMLNEDLAYIAEQINVEPENARLRFVDGVVELVSPAVPGYELDQEAAVTGIKAALLSDDKTVRLSMRERGAAITQANFADLGITTLIGEGTSDFSGSPANRIYNIKVGASKFDRTLIAPGETFSFLDTLGPVTAAAGYLPELVIKENMVVPDYGGGLCQVSTTMFRAAVYTGLPVTERSNHAFEVSYYRPAGTDATIYQPSPDLKFKNDTGGYILIQASVYGNTLKFELFGNDDGRVVTTEGPYSSPAGGGASWATWIQIVERGGQVVRRQEFKSFYKPASQFSH